MEKKQPGGKKAVEKLKTIFHLPEFSKENVSLYLLLIVFRVLSSL